MHSSALISREQIQALHSQLASMSAESPVAINIQQHDSSSNHHDYMNDDVLLGKTVPVPVGSDYINQDIVDMVLTDGQGQ